MRNMKFVVVALLGFWAILEWNRCTKIAVWRSCCIWTSNFLDCSLYFCWTRLGDIERLVDFRIICFDFEQFRRVRAVTRRCCLWVLDFELMEVWIWSTCFHSFFDVINFNTCWVLRYSVAICVFKPIELDLYFVCCCCGAEVRWPSPRDGLFRHCYCAFSIGSDYRCFLNNCPAWDGVTRSCPHTRR